MGLFGFPKHTESTARVESAASLNFANKAEQIHRMFERCAEAARIIAIFGTEVGREEPAHAYVTVERKDEMYEISTILSRQGLQRGSTFITDPSEPLEPWVHINVAMGYNGTVIRATTEDRKLNQIDDVTRNERRCRVALEDAQLDQVLAYTEGRTRGPNGSELEFQDQFGITLLNLDINLPTRSNA